MQYNWDSVLAPGESVKHEFAISDQYTKVILIAAIVGAGIVAFFVVYAGIAIGLLGLLYWWYMANTKHYCFTNKRIVLVEAFVGSTSISIDYAQITDIEIEQSFLDQIGGWGTLVINTAGTHAPEIRLPFIDTPQQVKKDLDIIRDGK